MIHHLPPLLPRNAADNQARLVDAGSVEPLGYYHNCHPGGQVRTGAGAQVLTWREAVAVRVMGEEMNKDKADLTLNVVYKSTVF